MNADFAQLRQRMVDCQIRTADVTKLSVLSVFLDMPREAFVPKDRLCEAYADGSVMVAEAATGQPARYMMPPASLARLIQLANIGKDDFILDIGGTTGYGAAIQAQLGSAVIALECDDNLLKWGENLCAAHECENITMVKGALPLGYAAQAPYDVIMLEGAVDFVPEALFAQLREGGRLIAVEGRGNAGQACLYEREDGVISRRRAFNMALNILPGFAAPAAFTF